MPEMCRQKYSRSVRQDNSQDVKLTYCSDPKTQIPCLASVEEQRVTPADHETPAFLTRLVVHTQLTAEGSAELHRGHDSCADQWATWWRVDGAKICFILNGFIFYMVLLSWLLVLVPHHHYHLGHHHKT